MKNISIIGLGQLGSRHLQALAKLNYPFNIELVDVSEASLETAVNRFYEIPESKDFKGTIKKLLSVEDLSEQLDLVIIACNSKERRFLTEALINQKKVKNLVLEKVLFPAVEDYSAIDALLNKHHVNTWVNCSRRMMPSYRKIKQLLTPGAQIDFSISGSNWGLGSNGIHFVDLFCFLTNDYSLALDHSNLDDNDPIGSTRKGYIDFTGTLTGKNNKGDLFKMSSYEKGNAPVQVIIQTPFERITVNEYLNKAIICSCNNNWQAESFDFEIMYQSQLTTLLTDDIFSSGSCNLPTYKEATKTHLLFLSSLLDYQKIKTGNEVVICQIT